MRLSPLVLLCALIPLAACTAEIKLGNPDTDTEDSGDETSSGEDGVGGTSSSSGATSSGSSSSGGDDGTSSSGGSSSGGDDGTSSSGGSSSGGDDGTSSSGGSSSGGSSSGGTSTGDAIADEFVAAHNAARALDGVAPLAWSEAAATVARNYAQQCKFTHNSARGNYGENLFASTNARTPTAVTESWASEKQYYNYANNSCQLGKQCGHYTQVVWENTTSVGCAIVECTTGSPFSGNGGRWHNVVCNYAPPGNYNGQRPF